MFGLLALFLSYALLTFGGVLPNSWFLLGLFCLSGTAACCLFHIFRHKKLDISLSVLFVVATLMFAFAPAKLGVGLVAGVWAWAAARNNNDARIIRFLHVLLFVGVAEAFLGLVQFFVLPGWIFGYVNTFNQSSGTLINADHYAGLLEMLIPVAFGLSYTAVRRYGGLARPYVYLLAAAFMGVALVFSISRMGILCFVITLCFLGLVLQLRRSQRPLGVGLALGILAFVIAGAVWIGIDAVVERYSDILSKEAVLSEGRLMVFKDTIRMIGAHPFGIGFGKYQDIFRSFQTFRPDWLFDHAHNDYLETAAEWGLPLAAAFWSFLFFTVIRGVRLFIAIESPEQRGVLLACSGAMFSILLHSLADFNLQIPSNAMLFFTFAGMSLAMPFTRGSSAT